MWSVAKKAQESRRGKGKTRYNREKTESRYETPKLAQTGKPRGWEFLHCWRFLFFLRVLLRIFLVIIYIYILFCDYLHGIFVRVSSKPQIQSPQSWFEPHKSWAKHWAPVQGHSYWTALANCQCVCLVDLCSCPPRRSSLVNSLCLSSSKSGQS